MTISFNEVPANLRVPFVAVEIDASRASQGPALMSYRALIIGQKIAAGTASDNSFHKVTNADQVRTLAGVGSQLHRMAMKWFSNNTFTECWIGVLPDGTTAATKTITVTGTATADGEIALYVGGDRVTITVTSGDAQNTVASAIDTALTADTELPVTSGVASNVVTATLKSKGAAGEDLDIRDSYQDGEELPAGISIAYAAGVTGAGNAALTSLIAAMGDTWYNVIAFPFNDATSLTAIETELADRFGPIRMIDGVSIASAAGSQATLGTLGNTRNSQHSVIVAQPGESPLVLPPEFAASVAAVVARYGTADPARPFQTLSVTDVLSPAEADLFTLAERELNLWDGIATTRATVTGQVQLDRMITTYKTNAAGADDTSYLDVTTMLTLMYLRYSFRTRMQNRYPRHKLADDGTRFGSGQAVITPKIGKAEAVAWFEEMEELGLVEDVDSFKTNLVVERNGTDPNRLDFLLPPDLINQLIVTAAQIQFRL